MTVNEKLLVLKDAGLSIKRQEKLKNLDLEIHSGDFLGIYGRNGSGKSLLAELLGGEIKIDSGERVCKEAFKVAVVSSSEKKRMLQEDRYNDDSEFMAGKTDPGRSVMDILKLSAGASLKISEIRKFVELFGIKHILERGIKFLSTGEFRKLMIVRALLSKPDLIIIDDPYTGLDIDTRTMLEKLVPEIRSRVQALVMISGRLDDLQHARSFYLIEDRKLKKFSDIEGVRKTLKSDFNLEPEAGSKRTEDNVIKEKSELIRMGGVNMSYYENRILNDINWTVNSGEHWQIIGPNGSGKSSLLSLVNGDSPKAYGQEIFLFGRKRGTGETVWDIKQNIGLVSGALQNQHRITQNVLSVVVSGFFDSVGLYDKPDPVQIEKARGWCREFGVESLLEKPFDSLSEGMKRAVLVIRAVVKHPRLLILDEPCQGLDDINSDFVLSAARRVISRDHSTLLYVSHDPMYRMKEITNVMNLIPHSDGGFTSKIES